MSSHQQTPFQPPTGPQQPAKSSKKMLWIILGISGGMILLCCGGCGIALWFGTGMLSNEARKHLATNDQVLEEIGPIESVSLNAGKISSETEKNPGSSVLVFDVVGADGSGEAIATMPQQQQQPGQMFEKLVFRNSSGEEFEVPVN